MLKALKKSYVLEFYTHKNNFQKHKEENIFQTQNFKTKEKFLHTNFCDIVLKEIILAERKNLHCIKRKNNGKYNNRNNIVINYT